MSALSKLQAYNFGILLSKPFKDWQEYKNGIIDEEGKILQTGKINTFENLIRKIKRLLNKFVPDGSFFQTLISLYLLKESANDNNELKEEIEKVLTDKEQELLYKILNSEVINNAITNTK